MSEAVLLENGIKVQVGKEKSHTPRKRSMLVVDEHTVNKLVKITPEKSLIVCLILTEVRLDQAEQNNTSYFTLTNYHTPTPL